MAVVVIIMAGGLELYSHSRLRHHDCGGLQNPPEGFVRLGDFVLTDADIDNPVMKGIPWCE